MPAQQVILITGTGRSGTNILKEILSNHPSIATLPFEYRFTIDPKGILDFYNTFPSIWSPYWVDYKIKELEEFLLSLAVISPEKTLETNSLNERIRAGENVTPPAYAGWELDQWIPGYSGFVQQLIQELVEFRYPARWPGSRANVTNNEMYFSGQRSKKDLQKPLRAFLQKCFDSICEKAGASVFVEDNTHSLLFAKDLFDLIPHAKMIHVKRDPRDVIASLKKQRWAPEETLQLCQWYQQIIEIWNQQHTQLEKGKVLEIQFESLIHSFDKTVDSVSHFMELPSPIKIDGINLDKHNIGRYKAGLSQIDLDIIREILN